MEWPRAGGILAHPTSFPGPYGIGDLGPTAERFFDFLKAGWSALLADPATRPHGLRQLALRRPFRLCGQSHADLARATRRG